MLRRSLLAALPLLAASPALAHPPRQPDTAEAQTIIEEIKAFREKIAKAVTNKDFPTLRALHTLTDQSTHSGNWVGTEVTQGQICKGNAPFYTRDFKCIAKPKAAELTWHWLMNVRNGHLELTVRSDKKHYGKDLVKDTGNFCRVWTSSR